MLSHPYDYIIYGITAILIIFGINYAIQIRYTPTRHGWTWSSVVTGTTVIGLGSTFFLYIIFDVYDLIEVLPWWTVFVPMAVIILVGAWMALGQISKQSYEDKRGQTIDEKTFDQ